MFECKNCKGKGHVLDASILGFAVIGWAIALAQTNDKSGMSRKVCSHCNGKGYVNAS